MWSREPPSPSAEAAASRRCARFTFGHDATRRPVGRRRAGPARPVPPSTRHSTEPHVGHTCSALAALGAGVPARRQRAAAPVAHGPVRHRPPAVDRADHQAPLAVVAQQRVDLVGDREAAALADRPLAGRPTRTPRSRGTPSMSISRATSAPPPATAGRGGGRVEHGLQGAHVPVELVAAHGVGRAAPRTGRRRSTGRSASGRCRRARWPRSSRPSPSRPRPGPTAPRRARKVASSVGPAAVMS